MLIETQSDGHFFLDRVKVAPQAAETVPSFGTNGISINTLLRTSIALLDTPTTYSALHTFPVLPSIKMGVVNSANVYGGTGPLLDDGSGFLGEFQCGPGTGSGLTANRVWNFPDGSGNIVLSGVQDVLVGNSSSTLLAQNASAGASFKDNVTATKRIRFVLVNSVGNNTFTIANTAARDYKFLDVPGSVVSAGGGATAVGAMTKVDLVTQSADIGSSKLTDTTPAGFYEVEAYLICTATDAGAGTATLTVSWTDTLGATTDATVTKALTSTGRSKAIIPIQLASGNITYTITGGGTYGTARYALYIRTVFLG
jgi:hypothetical protein